MLDALTQKVKDQYGSKSGLKNQWIYSAITRAGGFKKYTNIQIQNIERVIFVCAGNICRSPLAEAVARQTGIATSSYGLSCRGGDKADPRAIAYAATINLDLERHITKNISDYTPQAGDLLVGMEPAHAFNLEKIFGQEVAISLIGLWLSEPKAYIHDPFSTNDAFFSRCEHEVKKATLALASKLGRIHVSPSR